MLWTVLSESQNLLCCQFLPRFETEVLSHCQLSGADPHAHPFRRLTLKPPRRWLQSLSTSLRSPGVSWVTAMCDVMFASTEDPLRN